MFYARRFNPALRLLMIATRSSGGDDEIDYKNDCDSGNWWFTDGRIPAPRGKRGKTIDR
jgi:hypothetical protein